MALISAAQSSVALIAYLVNHLVMILVVIPGWQLLSIVLAFWKLPSPIRIFFLINSGDSSHLWIGSLSLLWGLSFVDRGGFLLIPRVIFNLTCGRFLCLCLVDRRSLLCGRGWREEVSRLLVLCDGSKWVDLVVNAYGVRSCQTLLIQNVVQWGWRNDVILHGYGIIYITLAWVRGRRHSNRRLKWWNSLFRLLRWIGTCSK